MRGWVPSSPPVSIAFTAIWEHSPSISTVAFNCIIHFPLNIFLLSSDMPIREKLVQGKALALLRTRRGLGAGLLHPSGVCIALYVARAAFILVALVTHGGPEQPPAPALARWNSNGLSHAPAGSEAACCTKPLLIAALTWLL